jgi:hypothetical protein
MSPNIEFPSADSPPAHPSTTRPDDSPEPIPKLDPPPSAKEYRLCLSHHRREINSAPPNERQALMERLIAQSRAKRAAA